VISGAVEAVDAACEKAKRYPLPAALALCFGFLTIRKDDVTVVDFLGYAARFFLTSQQYYEWREP